MLLREEILTTLPGGCRKNLNNGCILTVFPPPDNPFEMHLDHSMNWAFMHNHYQIQIQSIRNLIFASSELHAAQIHSEHRENWCGGSLAQQFEINITISLGLSLFFCVLKPLHYQGWRLLTMSKIPTFRKRCLIPF